jgi:signal transduction histidine kinase
MVDRIKKLELKFQSLTSGSEESNDRVDQCLAIIQGIVNEKPKIALEMVQEVYSMAKRLKYIKGEAFCLGLMGFSYYMMSNHEAALPKLLEALAMCNEYDFSVEKVLCLDGIASVHLSLGNYEQALSYLFEGIRIVQEIGNKIFEAWGLMHIGVAYFELGDKERSLQYFKNSIDVFEDIENDPNDVQILAGKARTLTGIGTLYQSLGENEKALQYHNRSLELFEKSGNKIGEARAFNDLGIVYQQLGEFDRSLQYHMKSLEIRENIGNRQAQSTSLINLGKLYIEQNDSQKALEVLNKALSIAQEIKAKPRIYQVHQALSEAYELSGDLVKTLKHHKEYHQVREEVLGEESNAKVKNLQIGFEVEKTKNEAEIERLRNVELREKNDQLEKLLKELQELQSQLVQTKKMAALGTLVAGLVHEMNTPIGSINSANDVSNRSISNILRMLETGQDVDEIRKSEQFQSSLKALEENRSISMAASERIMKIIDSLKSFSILDKAAFQLFDVHESLEDTLTILEHVFAGQIGLVKDYGNIPEITGYPGELNQVFMNLITNAAQAIKGEGTITVRTFETNGSVHIQISDTGVGIPPDQMQNLFDPSFSHKDSRIKAGFGLFASHNIVQKHKGDIRVDSDVGKGTKVSVILPVEGLVRLKE